MAKIKNYYAGANTSVGFYSLYNQALKGLKRVYILKGGPGTGKSTFMRKIGIALMEKGVDLEYYHCSSDNQSLDGVVAREIGVGLVDGTAPHVIEPKYPGVVEKLINLGEYRNDLLLEKFRESIIRLTDDISLNFEFAYKTFAQAKEYHMKKEKIYLEAMDFDKANKLIDQLMDQIFSHTENQKEKHPITSEIFFGAATPKGVVNFIDNITEDVHKRYIIKGRPGSGKSTLMKKIGKYAENLSFSVQYFPCGFDPSSIDMVIIPALSVCLIDGTAPHVVEPFRPNDEVIDMFKHCIDPTVEEGETLKKLEELDMTYKTLMTKGTNFISEAKRLHDRLEEYYIEAMDFEKINRKREQILTEILAHLS